MSEPLEFAPQIGLAAGPLGAAQEAERAMGRGFVARVRALAAFASQRPSWADRAQGEPGAMSPQRWAARPEILLPVTEWAAQEVSIGLVCSRRKAEDLVGQALMLVRLPRVLAAVEAGLLTVGHVWCLEEHVAPIADAALRAEIEAAVLAWVAARAGKGTITTPGQLADKVLREVTRRNARDRAREAIRALTKRGVFRHVESGEGLAGLGLVGTVPEIEALHAALAALVDQLPKDPADARTREQKLLDVLLDLVLRPGEGGHPPVQVVLTLVAGVQTLLGGDAAAELNGQIVSAETARQLLNALTGAGLGDGVIAELRRIADPEPADPGPADAPDPAEDACAVLDPFTPEEQALIELSAWFDELPWRIAAGDHDPAALEPPEELLAAWPGDLDELFEDGVPDDEAEPAEDVEIDDLTGSPPPPPEAGTWAAAERALDDARAVQEEAERALSHAGGLVRAAVWAEAEDEQAWRTGSGGRVDAAEDAMTALRAATMADRAALHALLGRTAAGGLAERPRLGLVDALSGALVSLTDLPGLRAAARDGTPLGAPPPTDGYRPGAELDRFLRARDRRCRFPGCRLPVSKGELDHRVRWPEGPTDVTNLVGFCTGDHRGKHQAPGFTHNTKPDGTLVVSTPSGLVATTQPPTF